MFNDHDCRSGLPKKFLESGVKRIFIIGLVPDVPELYVNVKRIWINCGINHLKDYAVAIDMKLCNVYWNDEPQLLSSLCMVRYYKTCS